MPKTYLLSINVHLIMWWQSSMWIRLFSLLEMKIDHQVMISLFPVLIACISLPLIFCWKFSILAIVCCKSALATFFRRLICFSKYMVIFSLLKYVNRLLINRFKFSHVFSSLQYFFSGSRSHSKNQTFYKIKLD